jgi:general stress protein 26
MAMDWSGMADKAPALAAAGERLFRSFTVGYFATLRRDGAPRIHPVTVTLVGRGLYVSTKRSTRKAADLRRDGRYALHAFPLFPAKDEWEDEEFMVGGRAEAVTDVGERAQVLTAHNDTVGADDPLWHLLIDRSMHKHRRGGRLKIEVWTAAGGQRSA